MCIGISPPIILTKFGYYCMGYRAPTLYSSEELKTYYCRRHPYHQAIRCYPYKASRFYSYKATRCYPYRGIRCYPYEANRRYPYKANMCYPYMANRCYPYEASRCHRSTHLHL